MNASDIDLIALVEQFLMSHVLQDLTATAHHDTAASLYSLLYLRRTRERPYLEHFLAWQKSPENTVRENPRGELMVYAALFPGRTIDLLMELLA